LDKASILQYNESSRSSVDGDQHNGRQEILLKEAQLTALADLGCDMLDTAIIETATYVSEKVK